ncbi:hypothetical protein, conserved [Trypanosoma brucei brucei TREU927]|uniref:Uncharacterized protein n=1 Tax=Trypanosoma brucei brucei (strain 927/4 GUTat10.1) TaxID=185431 RepID=Q4GYM8_TRYB2|nr:hypothetical protein, conserved [Trypanosoma brucei brucei TREU927]CAJ16556.1 hypothetical protein, conserved [Trypanosoma brucei brucei TREU927]
MASFLPSQVTARNSNGLAGVKSDAVSSTMSTHFTPLNHSNTNTNTNATIPQPGCLSTQCSGTGTVNNDVQVVTAASGCNATNNPFDIFSSYVASSALNSVAISNNVVNSHVEASKEDVSVSRLSNNSATLAPTADFNPALPGCVAEMQKFMSDRSIRPEEKEAVSIIEFALGRYAVARMQVKQRLEEGEAILRRWDELQKAIECAAASFQATSAASLTDSFLFTSPQQPLQHMVPNGPVGSVKGQRGRSRVDVDLSECKGILSHVGTFAQSFKKLREEQDQVCAALGDIQTKSPSHNNGQSLGFPFVVPPQREQLSLGGHPVDDLQVTVHVCGLRLRQQWEEVVGASCGDLLRGLKENVTANRALVALQGLCNDARERLNDMRTRIARLGSNRVEEAGRLDERLAAMDSYDPTMEEYEARRRQIDTELSTVKGWLEAIVQVQASADQLHETLRSWSAGIDIGTVLSPHQHQQQQEGPASANDRASSCWAVSTPSATTAAASIAECRLSSIRSSCQTGGAPDCRATYPQVNAAPSPVMRMIGTTVLPLTRYDSTRVGDDTTTATTAPTTTTFVAANGVTGVMANQNVSMPPQHVENICISVPTSGNEGSAVVCSDKKLPSSSDIQTANAPKELGNGALVVQLKDECAAVAVRDGTVADAAVVVEANKRKVRPSNETNNGEGNAAVCRDENDDDVDDVDDDDDDDADSRTSLFHPSAFSGGDRKKRRRREREPKRNGCMNTFASFFRAVINRATDAGESDGGSRTDGEEYEGSDASDDEDTEQLHKKTRVRLW